MLAGVDEAGRGALAGPVVAAAVILPEGMLIPNLTDSKKLTSNEREIIYQEIRQNSLSLGIGIIGHKTIDRLNILKATMLAMKKAVLRLNQKPEKVLIDGNKAPLMPDYDIETIVKGDQKYPCISAASIVAKVLRDQIMAKYDKRYPDYDFIIHKGYGTEKHYELIFKNGISPIHRKDFKLFRQGELFG